MYLIITLLAVLSMSLSTVAVELNSSEKPHNSLYWHALLQVADNQKHQALATVATIKQQLLPLPLENNYTHVNSSIDALFEQLFLDSVADDPQTLTWLGLFESIGIKEHNAHLTDVCPEALRKRVAQAKVRLQQLQQFPYEQLSPDQQVSYKIFTWLLNYIIEGEPFVIHEYQISQFEGVLNRLSALCMIYHRLEDEHDVEHYLARLSKIPRHLKAAQEFIEQQRKHGIILPRFAVEKTINIIKNMTPENVKEQVFYTRLADYLATSSLSHKDVMLQRAQEIMQSAVYPAYRSLLDYFTNVLLPQATTNHGVWAHPNGDAYYQYALKRHTTTDLTAQQIHDLGIQEVANIHQQMRKHFANLGMNDTKKTVGQLLQELAQQPHYYFSNDETGRVACLDTYKAIIERSRKELGYLFDLKPTVDVALMRIPEHEQEGAAAACYSMPSLDGARPGIFFVNVRNMQELPTFRMETLAIHEAEPGHHFQLALQCGMKMPILRKLGECTGFTEGWALYVEKLAYEQNFYSSDADKIGHLQDELLRAVRLVVDTGIHYKRWSHEQAVGYMQEMTGYSSEEVVTEIERYFVYPGQACAYKVGQLKILELRQRARTALADKFSIQEFHNTILQLGAAPLMVLEQVIDDYIAKRL